MYHSTSRAVLALCLLCNSMHHDKIESTQPYKQLSLQQQVQAMTEDHVGLLIDFP